MTFEQFQDQGRATDSIGREINDPSLDRVPGRVYPGGLYIERRADNPDGAWFAPMGYWSDVASDNLEECERALHRFAASIGEI